MKTILTLIIILAVLQTKAQSYISMEGRISDLHPVYTTTAIGHVFTNNTTVEANMHVPMSQKYYRTYFNANAGYRIGEFTPFAGYGFVENGSKKNFWTYNAGVIYKRDWFTSRLWWMDGKVRLNIGLRGNF